jgi:glutathione S-transferase
MISPAIRRIRAGRKQLDAFLKSRLDHMEKALAEREWPAGSFSIADILMADVLRIVDRFDGLSGNTECRAYITRAMGRPCFAKAYADRMAHFAAAD